MIRQIIERGGHEVAGEAENGKVAVEKYMMLQPDVVTMDLTMPEVQGIDALKQILSYDPKAKIIVCSAMGQQMRVVEAIAAGAKDFLVKPFLPDRLLWAIESV